MTIRWPYGLHADPNESVYVFFNPEGVVSPYNGTVYAQVFDTSWNPVTTELSTTSHDGTWRLGPFLRPDGTTLTAPIGTFVLDDRPTFRWRPHDGATGYRVEVYDTSFDRVADSGWITTAEWTPPAALTRGETYLWQLTVRSSAGDVTMPKPPAPEARFAIVSASEAARLETAAIGETNQEN